VSAAAALFSVLGGEESFWTKFGQGIAIALGIYLFLQLFVVQPARLWQGKSRAELTGSTEGAAWRLTSEVHDGSVLFEIDDLRDAPPLQRYCVIQDPAGVCWTSERRLTTYVQFPHGFAGAPDPPAASGIYRVSWYEPPIQGTVHHRLIARGDFDLEFQETTS